MLPAIEQRLAAEMNVRPQRVMAAVALLDEGATVPFISRYCKEATDGLDDTQIRNLEECLYRQATWSKSKCRRSMPSVNASP